MLTLLTGFEPWADHRRNPSGEVARALGGCVLPVDFDDAETRLRRLILEERPTAILMLGLAPDRRAIELEALALNIDHVNDPKARRWGKRIQHGPLALRSRLPLERIHRRLKRARIPVRLSHHAGTYVCNHVFYVALATTKVPCGFVHVPPFTAIPLAGQVRAVKLILDEL